MDPRVILVIPEGQLAQQEPQALPVHQAILVEPPVQQELQAHKDPQVPPAQEPLVPRAQQVPLVVKVQLDKLDCQVPRVVQELPAQQELPVQLEIPVGQLVYRVPKVQQDQKELLVLQDWLVAEVAQEPLV